MRRTLRRLFGAILGRFRRLSQPPVSPATPEDPYAWQPVRLRPHPGGKSGAVAVAEPDDQRVEE